MEKIKNFINGELIEPNSKEYFDNFSPAITLEAILANGKFFAFETNGTVLLALGFTSITKI